MIKITNLSKTFKVFKRGKGIRRAFVSLFKREYTRVEALRGIDLNVNDGEIVGYIGPNGAGKSTTIKIMAGILHPSGGECVINGHVPYLNRQEYVKDIGVVFGQRTQLWWDVPIIDSFELLKDIYKIDDKTYEDNLAYLTEKLNLSELIETPLRQLSLGQRMRCEIAGALLHSPKILFLDEPTIGLDAVSKLAVRDFIKKLNKDKKVTVILTTHDMNDIDYLTNRLVLIGKGKILYDGSLSYIKKKYASDKYLVMNLAKMESKIELNDLDLVEVSDYTIKVRLKSDLSDLESTLKLVNSKYKVNDFSIKDTSLEEIISSLYREYEII